MVSVSLGTRDPEQAKRLARARRAELDKAFAALEQAARPDDDLRGTVLYLSDADIDSVCERYRAKMLTEDELQRIKGFKPTEHELDVDILEAGLPDLRLAYARGDLTGVYPELNKYLKQLGLAVAKSSPSYERLARRFQQAELEVHEAILQRRKGVAVPIPLVATDKLSLDDVFKHWKRQKGTNPKTVRSFEQAFELFKAHCLAPTASMVKKADVVAFRDAMTDRGQISAVTLAKHISLLRAAFQIAVDDDKLPTNPFSGVKVSVQQTSGKDKSRLPFNTDELQKIFSGPVYQPNFEPRPSLGAACFWLPLMALFSGARLEELAQLEVSDVEVDPVHGSYICIRRAVDGSKRAKNLNSVRNFPVHPRLVEVGFLDFVKSRKSGRLFPALRADKYGILSTSFSTWFGLHLDELGITDSTRVFHSFRHNFVQRGKEKATKVPAEVREAIVGHIPATTLGQRRRRSTLSTERGLTASCGHLHPAR
jgi:integrase